ncbi:recombination mediator RecR [Prevotella sp. E13-17]|uniref:recombination mediator RecR n=1 Tax=Prevotella sp. E13-17 TaxID=2913616 RepID=UPI001EDBEE00|nr:recombination mediator RecR [Prevotella sp. E13-17]UKK49766.1 recombination mediator RecR [Prevotella sp. E13-17]
MEQVLPSRILQTAVEQLSLLPGVGRKTALRYALNLLRSDEEQVQGFTESISALKRDLKFCSMCHNISDTDMCPICSDQRRDRSTICVVSDIQDVMALENTQQYKGLYHVLGGVISPLDGVGPADLEIDSLVERVAAGGISEVILAISPTMEGDTTCFYIYRKLAPYDVKVTLLARGVAVGEDLEYTDEVTLGRSLLNRTPFDDK